MQSVFINMCIQSFNVHRILISDIRFAQIYWKRAMARIMRPHEWVDFVCVHRIRQDRRSIRTAVFALVHKVTSISYQSPATTTTHQNLKFCSNFPRRYLWPAVAVFATRSIRRDTRRTANLFTIDQRCSVAKSR